MKASVHTRYGPPEVLQLKEVTRPIPKAGEVLIRIVATTVNRTDCGFRNPEYWIVRLIAGIFRPRKQILGTELSGTVIELGKGVSRFKVGDEVFGLSTFKFGTHAEFICMSEKASLALKPANISHSQAASSPDGLMLAINYIRKIDFKTQNKILINGASGSIGSAAVQLARHYGGDVTAVCKTSAVELVRGLGASRVIDYLKQDFTQEKEQYDVILDSVGKSSFFRCKHLLKPGGIYFSSELGDYSQNIWLALITPLLGGRKVLFPIPTDSQKDMKFFAGLLEAGAYRPVLDRTYPLDQILEATKYVETGEKTGNVVITVQA